MFSVINKSRLHIDKKEQKCKAEKCFFKTIVFKVMKAISYLLKLEYRLIYYSKNNQGDESLSRKFHTT